MYETTLYWVPNLSFQDDGFGNLMDTPFDVWFFNYDQRFDNVNDEICIVHNM